MSPAAHEYAQALYTLSNRQSADRIDEVAGKIATAANAGDVTSREADWLNDICHQCRNNNWTDAQSAARQMMEDQIGR